MPSPAQRLRISASNHILNHFISRHHDIYCLPLSLGLEKIQPPPLPRISQTCSSRLGITHAEMVVCLLIWWDHALWGMHCLVIASKNLTAVVGLWVSDFVFKTTSQKPSLLLPTLNGFAFPAPSHLLISRVNCYPIKPHPLTARPQHPTEQLEGERESQQGIMLQRRPPNMECRIDMRIA